MSRTLTLLLLAACAPPPEGPDVDHALYWGAWATIAPVDTSYGTLEVALVVEGTSHTGRDTTYAWTATTLHASTSPTPGCTGTQTYAGDWRAACEETLVPDPTDPAFPLGSNTEGGCVELTVEAQTFGRQGCDAPADDVEEGPLSSDPPASFAALEYVRPDDDTLWLGWEPALLLGRVQD